MLGFLRACNFITSTMVTGYGAPDGTTVTAGLPNLLRQASTKKVFIKQRSKRSSAVNCVKKVCFPGKSIPSGTPVFSA
jgi:hypothetical protein